MGGCGGPEKGQRKIGGRERIPVCKGQWACWVWILLLGGGSWSVSVTSHHITSGSPSQSGLSLPLFPLTDLSLEYLHVMGHGTPQTHVLVPTTCRLSQARTVASSSWSLGISHLCTSAWFNILTDNEPIW